MIMMVREQEIRAQGREEGRREHALATFKRLLAAGMPEAQARALAFGEDEAEDEDCPEIDPQKTPELWADMMDVLAKRNRKMAQRMA